MSLILESRCAYGWPRRTCGWTCGRRMRTSLCLRGTFRHNAAGSNGLTILHFNDVYDVSPKSTDPVGGAARFVGALDGLRPLDPLILFSGDALSPSLLSTLTRGEHMIEVLNKAGVHAACIGNHEFDFGLEVLEERVRSSSFPWLLSNVADRHTGNPPAGLCRSCLLNHRGLQIGLMGLVERGWMETTRGVDLEGDLVFQDPAHVAHQLGHALRAAGAHLVIALTHMRDAADVALAAGAGPGNLDLILGGHDHGWSSRRCPETGVVILKSGTDFCEFSRINVKLSGMPGCDSSRLVDGQEEDQSGAAAANVPIPQSSSETPLSKPTLSWQHILVRSDTPENEGVRAYVDQLESFLGEHMDDPLGWTHLALDARSETMRTSETALGNLLADAMRLALGCDIAFFNGGTVRSDTVHPAGQLCVRDVRRMLPFTDELLAVELTGEQLVEALEVGLARWPAPEGRFLQVSGLLAAFDPGRSPGQRVIPESAQVAGEGLDVQRRYRVATKAFLGDGKDGYGFLQYVPRIDVEPVAPSLGALMQLLFGQIEELNSCYSGTSSMEKEHAACLTRSQGCAGTHDIHNHARHTMDQKLLLACSGLAASPLKELVVLDHRTGKYGVMAHIEGRLQPVSQNVYSAARTEPTTADVRGCINEETCVE